MCRVSIIIPVYKTEAFIERCLTSVFEQTLEDFEIIIVDDCSPDNSILLVEKLLEKYPHRKLNTNIVRLTQNVGSALARKIAFDQASGDYITCLDSDDYLELTALSDMLNRATETKSDIVICDYFLTYQDKEKIIKQKTSLESAVLDLLTDRIHSSYCNKLYRKELLKNITILDGINMCEDLLAMFQMLSLAKSISYIDKPYLHYVQYNNNSYTAKLSQKSCEDMISVIEFIENDMKNNNTFFKYQYGLEYRKLFIKYNLLTQTSRELRKNYFGLYLDLFGSIKHMPIINRFILYSSYYGLNFFIDCFIFFKKVINRK